MPHKRISEDEADAKRRRAVEFLNWTGNHDLADEFDAMTAAEYAEHKGLALANPLRKKASEIASAGPIPRSHQRRKKAMARSSDLQQQIDGLNETIDEAIAILEDAYTPEASREELAEAIGNVLDTLSPQEEDEDDEDGDNGDNGDDED